MKLLPTLVVSFLLIAVVPVVGDDVDPQVRGLLENLCFDCHNVDNREAGVRVDDISAVMRDRDLKRWQHVRDQISKGSMPPEDETQPTEGQRKVLVDWFDSALHAAKTRKPKYNGTVRRLTVPQYRNALRELMHVDDEVTSSLPPDAKSKDGFTNNLQSMVLSPLQVEAYFEIAEKVIDLAIVDDSEVPVIQNFRVDLGKAINKQPCPDRLILGANNRLLSNQDFVVSQPKPQKSFAFEPLAMQTRWRFNEGYNGNATVRGWRDYDSIYHAVFACMRGNQGYPKGKAYEAVDGGLLLRPAIPSAEMFKVESTYGPRANFKISLRQLPSEGNFRVTVRAAKYDDGLLLDRNDKPREASDLTQLEVADLEGSPAASISKAGVYQIDVSLAAQGKQKLERGKLLTLQLGKRHFSGNLQSEAFLAVRLAKGELPVIAKYHGKAKIAKLALTRLPKDDAIAKRFDLFDQRGPRLGVHMGLRRDCGSTLDRVQTPRVVDNLEPREFVFRGAINNYPSPDVQDDNDNYLAGVREIGVRSEYTDGRDMPRLLIESVRFEGPFYEQWPPKSHAEIFLGVRTVDREDDDLGQRRQEAGRILSRFASRAFRRPITREERSSLLQTWEQSYDESHNFVRSIQETLLTVLVSPQFLFLVEESGGEHAEPLNGFELASKLAFFLWNSPPDRRLLDSAEAGKLWRDVDSEIDRMISDAKFSRFVNQFAAEWLSLDKFAVVEFDRKRYPSLTREAREELSREPAEFLKFLIRENRSARDLVAADFVMANEVVAAYYGLSGACDSGFAFVPLAHENAFLGGVLTQAGILGGLSDGRESNPVKRGAWIARKIVAEPPDDPPPNVPELEEDTSHLPLSERLAMHRNQRGCKKCHEGIDPWGVPLESFDAGGLKKRELPKIVSVLPDGTTVQGFQDLKAYLAEERLDQVAFSFAKHLATYAIGRDLSYFEIETLRADILRLKSKRYPMREILKRVVQSDAFSKK